MRRALVAVGLLLVAFPSVSGESQAPLTADVTLRDAIAVGNLALDSAAWTLYLPMDRDAPLPAVTVLSLDAERVEVEQHFRTYAGTPAGLVGTDTQPSSESDVLEPAALRLDEVRAQAQMMVVPAGESATHLDTSLASMLLEPIGSVDVAFFRTPPGAQTPPELNRTYHREATALRLASTGTDAAVVVTGNFQIYLWDLDVRRADGGGPEYRSGTLRYNTKGQSPLTPDGVAYDARLQLLVLDVTAGRLSFVPQHTLEYYLDAPSTTVSGPAEWDLNGATGRLDWNGARRELSHQDLHLEGDFVTTFEEAHETGAVRAQWAGQASRVTAASQPLSAGTAPGVEHGFPWLWVGLLGLALAGAGSAGAFAWIRRTDHAARPKRDTLLEPRSPSDYSGALDAADQRFDEQLRHVDAQITKSIALLKLGRAREVIDTLEAAYDPDEPAAAIKAYLLSMAHLRLGRTEDGVRWILRSIELYPDFAQEVVHNEAFTSIRHDPRIRRHLDDEWGATSYA